MQQPEIKVFLDSTPLFEVIKQNYMQSLRIIEELKAQIEEQQIGGGKK